MDSFMTSKNYLKLEVMFLKQITFLWEILLTEDFSVSKRFFFY